MPNEIVRWTGRLGPLDLTVSEHTFRPSTISKLLAEALTVSPGDVVVDVGCGSGILSILAAKLGAARVFAVDISPDVEEVGRANAALHGVEDVITFAHGDLFDPLPSNLQADLIIGDVSGIPDDLAAESGWFPTGAGGGSRGSQLPIRMVRAARERLRAGGRLLLPTATLQDETPLLDAARNVFDRLVKLAERAIPMPGPLASSPAVLKLLQERVIALRERGSRFLWDARIWECSLADG